MKFIKSLMSSDAERNSKELIIWLTETMVIKVSIRDKLCMENEMILQNNQYGTNMTILNKQTFTIN